jgi:hypothetical protein
MEKLKGTRVIFAMDEKLLGMSAESATPTFSGHVGQKALSLLAK